MILCRRLIRFSLCSRLESTFRANRSREAYIAFLAKRVDSSTGRNRGISEFRTLAEGGLRGRCGPKRRIGRETLVRRRFARPFGGAINIPLPDASLRELLLRRGLSDIPGTEKIDYLAIVRQTGELYGADIDGRVNRMSIRCSTEQWKRGRRSNRLRRIERA